MTDLDELAAAALAALFSSAYDEAVTRARAVLTDHPSPTAKVRALTALTGALTCIDRGPEAVGSARHLVDELDRLPIPPGCARLARMVAGMTGVFFGARHVAVSPLDRDWPLLDGGRRYLDGELTGALPPLRAAFSQRRAGDRLFGSEATAALIVVLAELGHREEARRLLTEHPPDRVAMIPGLLPWSGAAVAAAEGRRDQAGDLAARAARLAAARGAPAIALTFLVDAARWGDPRRAARVLDDIAPAPSSALQRARTTDIAARASGSPARLVEAAEIQRSAGLPRHALELAELAVVADRDDRYGRRITVLRRQTGHRLGRVAPRPITSSTATTLTQREHEVARLAADGLSDRLIADELVVSIRTVQSHLASSYRKLGIRSRAELVGIT